MRAAVIAASHPAWPAPTTTTSNCSVNCIVETAWRQYLRLVAVAACRFHSNKSLGRLICPLADLKARPYSDVSYRNTGGANEQHSFLRATRGNNCEIRPALPSILSG